jgi:hypothetical protein
VWKGHTDAEQFAFGEKLLTLSALLIFLVHFDQPSRLAAEETE